MKAFLTEGSPESSTRLIALILALGFVGFAFCYPDQGGTLAIIGATLTTTLGAKVVKDVFAKPAAPAIERSLEEPPPEPGQ